ncbi:MAG: hypothetical protein LBO09_04055 [Candidatus Peribacteria bacterium]|jgi:hypothetical protein|nr:hypothetical protein [Candidatus Peribacteria bacterium]
MTTTEQIPTVQQAEQKEQSNGKFNISLLRIENKEDKFSYITNLSILSNITKSVLKTKLQLKGDDEDFQITEETNGKNYPNLIQQIERIKP